MPARTVATWVVLGLAWGLGQPADESKANNNKPSPPTPASAPAPAPGPAPAPTLLTQPLAGKRVPLADVLAHVKREITAMGRILERRSEAAKALGRMNASFQQRGYFRRVPTGPALAGLRADLSRLAIANNLKLAGLDARPDPDRPQGDNRQRAGVRWQPSLDDLRGVVRLTLDLQGPPQQVAAFINSLPDKVERMVLIYGEENIPDGVRLLGEAYYEHPSHPRDIDLRWPTLRERLLTAGWDPADASLKNDPKLTALRKAVEQGRMMVPQARSSLKVVADFPRWLLRQSFFEERSMKVASVRGELLLSTTLPGQ